MGETLPLMRILIIGCGYAGISVGKRLRELGHQVHGIRRSSAAETEMTSVGIAPIICDVTRPEQLHAIKPDFDWVVNLVSSSKGGIDDYRAVYLEGTRNLIKWLASSPPKKFVYTSSTSVYGQNEGELVDESSPTIPTSENAQILLQVEKLLLEAVRSCDIPSVILRVSGIYGPGRGHLFQQFVRGEARLSVNSSRLLNMVHVDDLAGIIIAALEKGQPGAIYNATDDEPVTEYAFFEWLSRLMNKPMPLPAAPDQHPRRKRALTSKRISNRKLKTDLDYAFQFPTYREGYQRLALAL